MDFDEKNDTNFFPAGRFLIWDGFRLFEIGHFSLIWDILVFKVLKNPKGGPFYVKKNFVSDSAQISCVKSLGHKDLKS